MNAIPTSRLVSVNGRDLPLQAAHVEARAAAGLARVTLRQTFLNPETVPAEVIYQLPLPPDAAVGAFAITIAGRRIVGRVERRARAREVYEQALFEGRAAGLLDEERDGLFTQQLGNVPPGATVEVEIDLDQPLAWRDGAWEWRFPTVVAPRYVDGGVPDAGRLAVDVADAPLPARFSLQLHVADALTGPFTSPSHAIDARDGHLSLPQGHVRLDRDVVIRWPVAAPEPGLTASVGHHLGETFCRLALVPPTAPRTPVARDLILLLDVSGSMSGPPMDHLQATSRALVDTLGPRDTLEMVAFGGTVQRWERQPLRMDPAGKAKAHAWIGRLRASGGTPMDEGIREALAGQRADAHRQVVLVTDGHIGFEERIIALIREHLPTASRLHTVGVGEGVNRGLLVQAARVGGGAEVILGLRDAVAPVIAGLVRRLDRPQVVDLTVSGDAFVESSTPRAFDLLAATPATLSLRVRPGTLRVQGRTDAGLWTHTVEIPATVDARPELGRLWAREAVAWTELEPASPGRDAAVEHLGLRWQIATKLTSMVAVSDDVVVDPAGITRKLLVPHEQPAGLSVEGLGLRRSAPSAFGGSVGGATYEAMPASDALGAPEITMESARHRPQRPMPMMAPPPPAPTGGAPMPRSAARAPGEPPRAKEEEAAPASPPSKAGVVSRLVQAMVGRVFGAEPAPLRFEVVRFTRVGDLVMFQIRVLAAGAWARPASLPITWSDGSATTLPLVAERSTPDGSVQPGDLLVLAVSFAGEARPLSVTLDGHTLTLPA